MERCKYPRTYHLPWSQAVTSDDKVHTDLAFLEGQEIVVTEKMDGENTSLYRNGTHARSIDSRHHSSRAWVKALQAQLSMDIPEGWRLCGENLYARHSVAYEDLEGFFYLFSIWNEQNVCLSWDETEEWAALMDLPTPRVLYRGIWDEQAIRQLADNLDTKTCEGFVVRTAQGFRHEDFRSHVTKWVRKGHVQTDTHWMHQEVTPNKLA